MSIEQVEKFIALATQDPALQAQLDSFQKASDPAGASAYFQELVAEAKNWCIHFSESDLQTWILGRLQQASFNMLSDEALETVVGGYSSDVLRATATAQVANLTGSLSLSTTGGLQDKLNELNNVQSTNSYLVTLMNNAIAADMKLFR